MDVKKASRFWLIPRYSESKERRELFEKLATTLGTAVKPKEKDYISWLNEALGYRRAARKLDSERPATVACGVDSTCRTATTLDQPSGCCSNPDE